MLRPLSSVDGIRYELLSVIGKVFCDDPCPS